MKLQFLCLVRKEIIRRQSSGKRQQRRLFLKQHTSLEQLRTAARLPRLRLHETEATLASRILQSLEVKHRRPGLNFAVNPAP